MRIRVVIVGYDLIGKRIADAVVCQNDMVVAGVFDSDPQCRQAIAVRGFPVLDEEDLIAADADVAVVCREGGPVKGLPVIYASHLEDREGILFFPMIPTERIIDRLALGMASADVIGLSRLVQAIGSVGRIENLYASIITRSGHATRIGRGCVDRLEPLPDDARAVGELAEVLGPSIHLHIRRVRVPYTHSNVHVIALDLDATVDRRIVLKALRQSPRVLVGSAGDGFATTADVQEFFRDSQRRRFDRPELFVWEESVLAESRRLYLTVDVCQEATSVPDTIDAIRLSRRPSLDWAESVRRTDEALGLGTDWVSPVSANEDRNVVTTPTVERSVASSAKTGVCLANIVERQLETPAKARVGVLGYGVIGRRVADAVRVQPDMEVVGVAGRPASLSLRGAQLRQYDVYVTAPARPEDAASRCCHVRGSLEDLLSKCDVLLDCTPSRVPGEYATLYDRYPQLTVIVQGGEKHTFGGISFNAFANYSQAVGKKRIRVISCSSTGTTRFVFTLDRAFGLKRTFAALTRRGADPGKPGKTPYNALNPTMGQSHHAPDVRTVLPELDLFSVSVDVPTTFGHVINFQAEVSGAPSRAGVVEALDSMPRVVVGRGPASTADLAEHYQDSGRSRRDRPEIYVWEESIAVEGPIVYAAISVHMESITIPDTVDCIRAALELEDDNWVSIHTTDCALGIEKKDTSYRRPITA